jgi:hypothetical protein
MIKTIFPVIGAALISASMASQAIDADGIQMTELQNESFIVAGFSEAEVDMPRANVRDPFSEPVVVSPSFRSKEGVKNPNEGEFDIQDHHYLSGVMITPKQKFCVVINPLGGSKIYKVGDTINMSVKKSNKIIIIKKIEFGYITTSSTDNKIKVGDEIY